MGRFALQALLVGTGGFAGSVARYALALGLQRFAPHAQGGTLAANLAGCLLIGVLAGIGSGATGLTPGARLLLMTGFCGGFTTASTMTHETAELLGAGHYGHAGGYVVITLVGCLACFFVGLLLAKLAVHPGA